ncbi:MAG: hypothetical protein B7Y39_00820 [Bdellovibrio sp. 28-41-41]|nr:MAG: hypothetical protein B7Y39_00820 [Bdellovibrio sp. 28-41-41]
MNSMKDEFILADQIREKLFLRVQKAMEQQDISQGEMARRIGAARTNINRVMCRKNAVSIDFLLKMAESIGLDVELKMRPKEPEKPHKLAEKAQKKSR